MEKLELGYWPIKGRAESIRFLLSYLKVPYTEYNPKSSEEWLEKANTLNEEGLHFPNLPYIRTTEGFYLSETSSILIYICKKFDRNDLLGGDNLQTRARIFEIFGVQLDVFLVLKSIYNPDVEKAKAGVIEAVKKGGKFDKKMNFLNNFLGDKTFFFGDSLTVIDFNAAFAFYFLESVIDSAGLEGEMETRYGNLKLHKDRIFELEGVKEHIAGDGWKRPLLVPQMVSWVK